MIFGEKTPHICISSEILMISASQPSPAAVHEVFVSSLKIRTIFYLTDF